jgi:hypothetical protein
MSTQTEQQLEDITALLAQPATATELPSLLHEPVNIIVGEQPEFAIDLSQVVAEQNAANPELNTIAGLDQLTLTPETNVVNLEPETLNPTAAAAEKVTKKAQKEAEKAEKAAAKAVEKAKKEAEKAAEKAKKEAEKAAKAAANAEPEEKVVRIEQNGIKEPSPGTSAKAIWSLINELSNAKGALVTGVEIQAAVTRGKGAEGAEFVPYTYVTKSGAEVQINSGNLNPEFWAYKKFHGLTSIKEFAEK